MSDKDSYSPWYEAVYSGKDPQIISDIYSPLDIMRNLVKNYFGLERCHGPCSKFKDKDFNEYYLSKDKDILVRLSDREGTAIRTEDYTIEFTDFSKFLSKLNEEFEERIRKGDMDNADLIDMAVDDKPV